jgi:hypothetical protein
VISVFSVVEGFPSSDRLTTEITEITENIEHTVIVELKAVQELNAVHEARIRLRGRRKDGRHDIYKIGQGIVGENLSVISVFSVVEGFPSSDPLGCHTRSS